MRCLVVVVSMVMMAGLFFSGVGGEFSGADRENPGVIDLFGLQEHVETYVAGGIALLFLVISSIAPRFAPLLGRLLIALAVLESASFAHAMLVVRSERIAFRNNPVAEFLHEKAEGWRVYGSQLRLLDLEALKWGLLKTQEYEPVPLIRPLRYLSAALDTQSPFEALNDFFSLDLSAACEPLIDLWAVRYLIRSEQDPRPPKGSRWRLIQEFEEPFQVQVWENPDALPRGFVVGEVLQIPQPATEANVEDMLATLEPRKQLLLPNDGLPTGSRQDFTPAKLVKDTPNQVVLEVETQAPGYLVLSDIWYPGWTAEIDGQPASVVPANYAFRAVALPVPGQHRVTFNYFPIGLIEGLVISFLTLLILVSYCMIWPSVQSIRVNYNLNKHTHM